jgi:hypothetical protein
MLVFALACFNLVTCVFSLYKHCSCGCILDQRSPAGGSRATSGPKPLVTQSAKLLVNLLLVTIESFTCFSSKDLKNRGRYCVRYRLLQEKM